MLVHAPRILERTLIPHLYGNAPAGGIFRGGSPAVSGYAKPSKETGRKFDS